MDHKWYYYCVDLFKVVTLLSQTMANKQRTVASGNYRYLHNEQQPHSRSTKGNLYNVNPYTRLVESTTRLKHTAQVYSCATDSSSEVLNPPA